MYAACLVLALTPAWIWIAYQFGDARPEWVLAAGLGLAIPTGLIVGAYTWRRMWCHFLWFGLGLVIASIGIAGLFWVHTEFSDPPVSSDGWSGLYFLGKLVWSIVYLATLAEAMAFIGAGAFGLVARGTWPGDARAKLSHS